MARAPNLSGFRAGTSDPLDFRFARPVGQNDTDTLKAGAAYAGGGNLQAVVAIAGAFKVRFRGLFTAEGLLKFYYLRPASIRTADDVANAYDQSVEPPHADKSVTGTVEFVVDIEPVGESDLLIVFVPDGDAGTVTFFDVMNL